MINPQDDIEIAAWMEHCAKCWREMKARKLTPQQKRLRASMAFDLMFPNAHPREGYGV